jgi:hypothetical protein
VDARRIVAVAGLVLAILAMVCVAACGVRVDGDQRPLSRADQVARVRAGYAGWAEQLRAQYPGMDIREPALQVVPDALVDRSRSICRAAAGILSDRAKGGDRLLDERGPGQVEAAVYYCQSAFVGEGELRRQHGDVELRRIWLWQRDVTVPCLHSRGYPAEVQPTFGRFRVDALAERPAEVLDALFRLYDDHRIGADEYYAALRACSPTPPDSRL